MAGYAYVFDDRAGGCSLSESVPDTAKRTRLRLCGLLLRFCYVDRTWGSWAVLFAQPENPKNRCCKCGNCT